MPLPLVAAAGLAARVAPYVMALAPMIADFFTGKSSDDDAAKQIGQARDGLAARIAASERIPLAQAQAAVDEQLKPIVEQHQRDAGGSAGHLVSDALGVAGGVMLGKRMGAGKAAAGVAAAAEPSAPQMAQKLMMGGSGADEDVGNDMLLEMKKRQMLGLLGGG